MVRKLIVSLFSLASINFGLFAGEENVVDIFDLDREIPTWVEGVVRLDSDSESSSFRTSRYQLDRLSVARPSVVKFSQLDSRGKKVVLDFISAIQNSDGKLLSVLWPDSGASKSEAWFNNRVRFFRDYKDAKFVGWHIEHEPEKYIYMEYFLFSEVERIVEEKIVTFKYSPDLEKYTIFEM
jgi:hypothetical protein